MKEFLAGLLERLGQIGGVIALMLIPIYVQHCNVTINLQKKVEAQAFELQLNRENIRSLQAIEAQRTLDR